MKYIIYFVLILISANSYASNYLNCQYNRLSDNTKQIVIDNKRNGYWILDNKNLYFFNNQDNLKLFAKLNLKLTQSSSGIALYNNNLLVRYTNNINEYNADKIYSDGVIAYLNQNSIDLKDQSYIVAKLPGAGSIGDQNSKLYSDHSYLYAAYGGLGRQIYVWKKDNGQWNSLYWLDGSNNTFGVTMGYYKNRFYFRNNGEKYFSLCTYDQCYYHGTDDNLPIFYQASIYTFNYNEDICVFGSSNKSEPSKIYCKSKGEINLENVSNIYDMKIQDIAYNSINNTIYILEKDGIYKCK
jgi:hypothetical protein